MGSSRGHNRALGLGFPTLVGGHRVVRYDVRGHGDSRGAADPADYRWPNLARDLLVVADRVAPDEPVDAVGVAMGAAVILHAALIRPAAFRRLVLVVPPTAWETRSEQAAGYERAAVLVERHGLGALAAAGVLDRRVAIRTAAGPGGQPQISADLFPAVLRGAARTDLPPAAALATLTQPTLILPWADDLAHPVSTAARLGEVLPAATVAPAAAGAEQVATWSSMVEEFLRPPL